MSASTSPPPPFLTIVSLDAIPPLRGDDEVKTVKLIKHDSTELNEQTCAICLDDFNERRSTAIKHIFCRNYFHFDCVQKWTQTEFTRDRRVNFLGREIVIQEPTDQPTCPNCRRDLDKRPFDELNFGKLDITKKDWRTTEIATEHIRKQDFSALTRFLDDNLPQEEEIHRTLPYSAFKLPLIAASSDSPESLRRLRDQRFKLDAIRKASGFRQTPLFQATVKKAHQSMRFLLQEAKINKRGVPVGAAPDASDHGRPLNAAAYLADTIAIQMLLTAKANPQLTDHSQLDAMSSLFVGAITRQQQGQAFGDVEIEIFEALEENYYNPEEDHHTFDPRVPTQKRSHLLLMAAKVAPIPILSKVYNQTDQSNGDQKNLYTETLHRDQGLDEFKFALDKCGRSIPFDLIFTTLNAVFTSDIEAQARESRQYEQKLTELLKHNRRLKSGPLSENKRDIMDTAIKSFNPDAFLTDASSENESLNRSQQVLRRLFDELGPFDRSYTNTLATFYASTHPDCERGYESTRELLASFQQEDQKLD